MGTLKKPRLNEDLLREMGRLSFKCERQNLIQIKPSLLHFIYGSRGTCLSVLLKMQAFNKITLRNKSIYLHSAKDKDILQFDLRIPSSYLIFERLIEIMIETSGNFITEIYFHSFNGLSKQSLNKLSDSLLKLKGVTFLSFPFQFEERGISTEKIMRKLMNNFKDDLKILKHVKKGILPVAPFKEKVALINMATLRDPTFKQFEDYFAYYARGVSIEHLKQEDDGIAMGVNIHRHTDVYGPFISLAFKNDIVHLLYRVTFDFDRISLERFLNRLPKLKHILPKLRQISLEVILSETDPGNCVYPFGDSFDEENFVPQSVESMGHITDTIIHWLEKETKKGGKLPLLVKASTRLLTDYSRTLKDESLLERALKQIIDALGVNELFVEFKSSNRIFACSKERSIGPMSHKTVIELRSLIIREDSKFDDSLPDMEPYFCL